VYGATDKLGGVVLADEQAEVRFKRLGGTGARCKLQASPEKVDWRVTARATTEQQKHHELTGG